MTVGILIPIPREFVLTAAANTLAGAELYVYENTTTTPVSLFSDRACTVPAANPIVSSAGFFPRRYMASAQLLTLTLKNTAGSTIHSDDYVDPGYGGVHQSALFNPVYDLALTTAGGTTAYTVTTGLSLSAYTSGQSFLIKMNATNTGASTLNVDGLGAKSITKNGTTALVGGELVSGVIYRVAYDGTQFQIIGAVLGATGFVPVGSVQSFAGSTAPTGWLLCYGQAVSRTTYAALFAIISTTYGVGDGSTTFNLPDLRGRVVAGKDNMGGSAAARLTNSGTGNPGFDGSTLGAAGGVDRHTITVAQMPSHTHTGTTDSNGSHNHSENTFDATAGAGYPIDYQVSGNVYSATGNAGATTSTNGAHTHTFTSASNGSSAAHPIVQPTLVMNSIIFAGV